MLAPLDVLRAYPQHDYTLGRALLSRQETDPGRPFMVHEGHEWTWTTFRAQVEQAAGALIESGVGKGDRIAISARNNPAHIILLFACAQAGAVLVPINPDFGIEEARYVLGNCEPSMLFVSRETRAVCAQAISESGSGCEIIGIDAALESGKGVSFASFLSRGKPVSQSLGSADDCCIIIYTSGTTGFPKGVMHSQRSLLLAGEAFVTRMNLQPEDRLMIVLPLYHMNAMFYSVGGAVAAGASLLLAARFSASRFWDIAAEGEATIVNIIEAIGTILAARDRSEYRSDHRIRAVYGARKNVADCFRNEFNVSKILSGFGMTEVPGVTCNPFFGLEKPGSMGLLGAHPDPSVPWAQCRIVDDEGRDVEPNAIGELLVKTPIATMGYFRAPDQTAQAFEDGWFKTGDLISRDEDGWFYFVSRKKDIIRRRGENIAGAELDRVIGEHPNVSEAAAVAVPSELGEDEILAVVVGRDGSPLKETDIVDWCRARLSEAKVPRYVILVDELPHTATHKVAKAALRQDQSLLARAFDTLHA